MKEEELECLRTELEQVKESLQHCEDSRQKDKEEFAEKLMKNRQVLEETKKNQGKIIKEMNHLKEKFKNSQQEELDCLKTELEQVRETLQQCEDSRQKEKEETGEFEDEKHRN